MPKRCVQFSMSRATRAGTCLEAVASALSASAGLTLAALAAAAAACGALLLLALDQRRLGPTHTARFDADIMFCDALPAMCVRTHKKCRNRHTCALGNRSHNLPFKSFFFIN